MQKKVLITGGNGFIGHHVCEHLLKNTDWNIDIMDRMTYASMGFDRLKDVQCYDDKRIRNFSHNFIHPIQEMLFKELSDVNYIVHLGAESHVDKSIENALPFVMSNVVGTLQILEFARQCKNLEKMIYFSTDEIFGPADKEKVPNGFKEWDSYNSTNPYSASKAGGEELCLAFANTHKVPVLVTHTMNVFGERQHPEKFIPMTIRKIRDNEEVIIHSDSTKTIPGSRFWRHARNVASAVSYLLEHGRVRDKYNVVGEVEVNNILKRLMNLWLKWLCGH